MEAATTRHKPFISIKNQKARLEFIKKVFWIDGTKTDLYDWDGNAKVYRKNGSGHNLKYTSSSVKHDGGRVVVCPCKAAYGTRQRSKTHG